MGMQDKLPNSSNSMRRVNVYRLNEDGKWDDQGTGHVTVDYLERSEELALFVIDEEDKETLLLHRISSDDIYHKQEDTIISWNDPEYATELALSFQETSGCSYIWDHICNLQRNMHFNSLANDTFNNVSNELVELPPVELSTLSLILKIVENGSADPSRVTELILKDDFFKKLMELFRICEDLEDIDGLHLIFKIVKGIILLNSSPVFEKIFGDDLMIDIIGCLEYDPESSQTHHRSFLKDHVVFKEHAQAIPIKNPLALSKIHQNYRLGYLKDVILPNALDEGTVVNINSIIHSNNVVVVSLLKDDSTFIKELFDRLKSLSVTEESKKNLFCTLSKSLQMTSLHRLFRDLVSEGIFDIISDILQSDDHKLVLTGTDILMLYQNLDAITLRSYVTKQEVGLFGLLVKNMLRDFGDDMHCQYAEIIRRLLDPMTQGPLKENVAEIFYDKHLGQLVDAIASSCLPKSEGDQDCKPMSLGEESMRRGGVKPEILLTICDLLCFCVLQHPYWIKCGFLLNNSIDKVLYLTRRREKYLVLAAIRFLRALVSHSDEHLMNHIARNNTFKPIVETFVANGDRYNLLNSAVLDLFEYIRKENLKVLLRYLVDTFWDQLSKFENLPSIYALKVKYEQMFEVAGTRTSNNPVEQRKRHDERAMEKEEEDYFNEDSDEEDSASARVSNANCGSSKSSALVNGPNPPLRLSGLVDYDDDEDDKDYKPPPKKSNATDENDELLEFPLKRKLNSKEDSEAKKLKCVPKGGKPSEVASTAPCSTHCEAVLPSKKAETSEPSSPSLEESCSSICYHESKVGETEIRAGQRRDSKIDSQPDREVVSPTNFTVQPTDSDDHRMREAEHPLASCSYMDQLNEPADNTKSGDDHSLMSSNSSPEMAVSSSCLL